MGNQQVEDRFGLLARELVVEGRSGRRLLDRHVSLQVVDRGCDRRSWLGCRLARPFPIFIPSDAPYTRKALLRALREGQPAVLVFPDGQERIVHGESPSPGGWFSDLRDRLVGLRGLLH